MTANAPKPTRRALVAGAATWVAVAPLAAMSAAAPRPEIDSAANDIMARLLQTQPDAAELFGKAAGVLIFPEIIKGGLLVGGAMGQGVLRIGGETEGYYRSTALSYGLQLGLAKFGYVMLLMDAASLDYVRRTDGWEVGVGPNVTIVDAGFARKISTTSTQDGIFVFFVDQQGFFGGAGIEGAKITQISG